MGMENGDDQHDKLLRQYKNSRRVSMNIFKSIPGSAVYFHECCMYELFSS